MPYDVKAGEDTGAFRFVARVNQPAIIHQWFDEPHRDRPPVTSPEAASDLLRPLLTGRDREHCFAVHLDTKHHALAITHVSTGTVDHTFVAPREILRDSLLLGASAIVIGHNHPSGSPQPSNDDEAVTRRLSKAGEMVGVTVLDHMVFGDSQWVSLARRGVC